MMHTANKTSVYMTNKGLNITMPKQVYQIGTKKLCAFACMWTGGRCPAWREISNNTARSVAGNSDGTTRDS